jgi:glycosyltransferase involved in cell wall biosynthesis
MHRVPLDILDITVVIPTIPQRKGKLRKAISSVMAQTYPVSALSVAVDLNGEGSARTRNRALAGAMTDWVVFLDDDDQFLPSAIRTFAHAQRDTNADVVYGLPRIVNAQGIIQRRFFEAGGPEVFDSELLRQKSYIPVVSLVRTQLAERARFFYAADTNGSYDDWGFYLNLLDLGARFHHVHQETFIWNIDGGNTSGRPDRGDALNG